MVETQKLGEQRLRAYRDSLTLELSAVKTKNDVSQFAVQRQVGRCLKKARFVKDDLNKKAFQAFVDTNNRMEHFIPSVDADILENASFFIRTAFEKYTAELDENLSTLCLDHLLDLWRFGPGASNGVNGTHTAEKIGEPMTSTLECEPFVKWLRLRNPYFRLNDKNGNGLKRVAGSRMSTVPKNEDTVRTIAIEPSGNMCLQLAAGDYITAVLSRIGLKVSHQQDKNVKLALTGSFDGSIATIDLKSASDMISPILVCQLMPVIWSQLLWAIRSPVAEIPDYGTVELHMMSTMGNGFTFPLMTLIIVSLIYGLRCRTGGPNLFIDWSETGVYGDDIIVPVHEYTELCSTLEKAGFVINHDKSYCDGFFRESCGGDFYRGVYVTPFYIKDLTTASTIYVAINGLASWAVRFGIWPYRTIDLLKSYIDGEPFLVPEWHNPEEGILSCWCPKKYKYLAIRARVKRIRDARFLYPLCVGGYISQVGDDYVFTPRSKELKVVVRKGRLPKGYLSGWDPDKGSQFVAEQKASLLST